jgi:hypothetical protein
LCCCGGKIGFRENYAVLHFPSWSAPWLALR